MTRKQQAALAVPDGSHQEAPAGGEEGLLSTELGPGAFGSPDVRLGCAMARAVAGPIGCVAGGGRQGLRFSPQAGLRRQQ